MGELAWICRHDVLPADARMLIERASGRGPGPGAARAVPLPPPIMEIDGDAYLAGAGALRLRQRQRLLTEVPDDGGARGGEWMLLEG